MTRIAHLSDLHFGRTEAATLEKLSAAVASVAPDAVVVTGDLTQSGRRREFLAAAEFLQALRRPVIAVPGNHDVPVRHLGRRFLAPWKLFAEHIGVFAAADADIGIAKIIGINSARRAQARMNWSYGKLKTKDILRAAEAARGAADDKIVFIAAHHPFEQSRGVAGARIVGRGALGLKHFAEAGVAAVLTGHVHVTSIRPLAVTGNRILSVQAGTSASTRLREENASFLEIECASASELRIRQLSESKTEYRPGAFSTFLREAGAWRIADG